MKSLLFPAFFCILPTLSAQTVYFVDHGVSGGNSDGSSWTNAFLRVQQALAVAQDGDEIWVAKGVYKPTGSDDRYARYDLPSGVSVYGGFSGTETLREQRDWAANPTILSGDIGNPGDSTDNSFTILYSYSPNEKTRLDGLIFEEGNATNTDNSVDYHRPTRSGGGIYLDGEGFGYAQLSVANCVFRRNRALYQGGGIYANGLNGGMAIVNVDNCLFENNNSKTYGAGLSIDNLYEQPFPILIKNSAFDNNYCSNSGSAIWLQCHQNVSIDNCNFSNNNSLGGTTAYLRMDGNSKDISVEKCKFTNNRDHASMLTFEFGFGNSGFNIRISKSEFLMNTPKAISVDGGVGLINLMISNCIFASSQFETGVLYWSSVSGLSKAHLSNCLLYKNEGYEFHTYGTDGSPIFLTNCILIGDDNNNTPHLFGSLTTPTYLNNCLISQATCSTLGFNVFCGNDNLFGNNPLFVNPSFNSDADFHLQICSPAINAGTNAILDSLGITTDLDDQPRIRNTIVDLGPYETSLSLHPSASAQPVCAGDSTGVVEFSPDICPPFDFMWDNGDTTGTNISGLAAGTYIFTATGANHVSVSDTLVIHEPPPLQITLETIDVHCFGYASGQAGAVVSGGTSPYQYNWNPPYPPVQSLFNLPAGSYSLTVTDDAGCTGSILTTIGTADQIHYFFSVQNASCAGCPDGSVVFDSVTGGVNPPLPPPMLQLVAGNYCLTLTDAAGCTTNPCFTVGVTIDTKEVLEEAVKFHPNPTISGGKALLEWSGSTPATLRIWDFQGRVLEEDQLPSNATINLKANWPPGIYSVEIRTQSGQYLVRRWVIL